MSKPCQFCAHQHAQAWHANRRHHHIHQKSVIAELLHPFAQCRNTSSTACNEPQAPTAPGSLLLLHCSSTDEHQGMPLDAAICNVHYVIARQFSSGSCSSSKAQGSAEEVTVHPEVSVNGSSATWQHTTSKTRSLPCCCQHSHCCHLRCCWRCWHALLNRRVPLWCPLPACHSCPLQASCTEHCHTADVT